MSDSGKKDQETYSGHIIKKSNEYWSKSIVWTVPSWVPNYPFRWDRIPKCWKAQHYNIRIESLSVEGPTNTYKWSPEVSGVLIPRSCVKSFIFFHISFHLFPASTYSSGKVRFWKLKNCYQRFYGGKLFSLTPLLSQNNQRPYLLCIMRYVGREVTKSNISLFSRTRRIFSKNITRTKIF